MNTWRQKIEKALYDGRDSFSIISARSGFGAPLAIFGEDLPGPNLALRFLPYVGWVTIIMTEKPIIKTSSLSCPPFKWDYCSYHFASFLIDFTERPNDSKLQALKF
ncbi:hypothetical protein WN943_022472 [Citrus x changshan-huyou]